MPPLDPGYLISLAFSCLPAVVGVVGLCLLPRFPRAVRGTAVSGLVLLTASSVVHVLVELFAFRLLGVTGLVEVSIAVGYLSTFMIAAGLLFLALAATRRDPVEPTRPQAEPWQGAPAPHPGMPQPHPGYGQPGPAQPGPAQPGSGHSDPRGGA
ncbi:hypothetical protein [Nocardiopsis oceani]